MEKVVSKESEGRHFFYVHFVTLVPIPHHCSGSVPTKDSESQSNADRQLAGEPQPSSSATVPEWPVFAWADQAEVLRASQKDEYYVRQLKGMAEDFAEHALGGQALSRSVLSNIVTDVN